MFIEDCKTCKCKVCKDITCRKEMCYLHKKNQSSFIQAAFPMEKCDDYVDTYFEKIKRLIERLFRKEKNFN